METTSLIPGIPPSPRNCALSSQHQPVGLFSLKQSALESSDSNSEAIPNSRFQMNTQDNHFYKTILVCIVGLMTKPFPISILLRFFKDSLLTAFHDSHLA